MDISFLCSIFAVDIIRGWIEVESESESGYLGVSLERETLSLSHPVSNF